MIMNKKIFLAIQLFVKFGYNYPRPEEFINYICQRTGKTFLVDHLRKKFDNAVNTFGSHAAMNYFLCQLDTDLQEALIDYALNVYAPRGMKHKYEEYAAL